MGILYWLNDTEGYAQLVERARPVVEAHGSAEQRKGFLLNVVGLSLRRDRYLSTDETVEIARAAYAIPQDDRLSSGWARFNLAFALLWHGDLGEAATLLRDSLADAETCGDAGLKSRCVTYLMVIARKRSDVDEGRESIGSVIEHAREASLPEYEAMAIANRAWVTWRAGDEETATADALSALDPWETLPVRYFYDWMALWPLLAISLAAGRTDEAAGYARRMLPPPQQLLQQPARDMVEHAVQAWDAGKPAEATELLRTAVRAAGDLGYL